MPVWPVPKAAVPDALQIVSQEGLSGLDRLRAEYVVRIQGQLRKRSDPNPNIPTGMVELVAEQARRPSLTETPQAFTPRSSSFWLLHPCRCTKESYGHACPRG